MYCALFLSSRLGYYVSPKKSQLDPVQRMIHLGFGIDSTTSSYFLTEKRRLKFRGLRERLLSEKVATLHDIQSFVGKCNSLRLVFPAASLFSRNCCTFMRDLSDTASSPLPESVLEEILFWRFVDAFTKPVSWRKEQHVQLRLSSDASPFGWGSTVIFGDQKASFGDYFSGDLCASRDMCFKEALALYSTLQSVAHLLWDRRVDILMDNRGLVDAWNGLRGSSSALVSILRCVFLLVVEYNASVQLTWVPSKKNPADAPSRVLSRKDAMLRLSLRLGLWQTLGPFSFDLMALASNVFSMPGAGLLPFFSESHCPGSSGVNVFAQSCPAGRLYVFPPFLLIPALLRLFLEWGSAEVVIVVPVFDHFPPWWSLLQRFVASSFSLFPAGSSRVLSYPSKKGFSPNLAATPFGLTAFLCNFPPSDAPLKFFAPPSVSVVVVSDSMFRCLQGFSWPHPFAVRLFCSGGQLLMDSVCRMYDLIPRLRPAICIIHSGINDLSSGGGVSAVQAASTMIRAAAPKFCAGVKVIFSAVTQTRDAEINGAVAKTNVLLRETCDALGWLLQNNDFILQSDLRDNVHLSVSGAVKIHRALSHSLRIALGTDFGVHV